MIFTERQITVHKGKSSINEPVILYRGDFEVSIRFTIMESKFRFKSGVNLVDSEKASFGQLAILAPYGGNVFSEVVKCEDGTVTFTLTKEMIDQLEEVGLYSFQIRLFDYYRESRVSIPPVEFGIEVREPVASEDHDNEVNNAIVGYSIAKVVDPSKEDVGDTFNASGNYNKTDWKTGDRITEGKLNKIEDALDKINQNEINDKNALNKQMTSNFNVLQTEIDNKANKGEVRKRDVSIKLSDLDTEVKEAMTGGSVAVIGNDCVGVENIKPYNIYSSNLSSSLKESIFNKIKSDIECFETGSNQFRNVTKINNDPVKEDGLLERIAIYASRPGEAKIKIVEIIDNKAILKHEFQVTLTSGHNELFVGKDFEEVEVKKGWYIGFYSPSNTGGTIIYNSNGKSFVYEGEVINEVTVLDSLTTLSLEYDVINKLYNKIESLEKKVDSFYNNVNSKVNVFENNSIIMAGETRINNDAIKCDGLLKEISLKINNNGGGKYKIKIFKKIYDDTFTEVKEFTFIATAGVNTLIAGKDFEEVEVKKGWYIGFLGISNAPIAVLNVGGIGGYSLFSTDTLNNAVFDKVTSTVSLSYTILSVVDGDVIEEVDRISEEVDKISEEVDELISNNKIKECEEPNYIIPMLEGMRDKITSIAKDNSFTFAFVTDTHLNSNYTRYGYQLVQASKIIPITHIIHGGDIIHGTKDLTYEKNQLNMLMKIYLDARVPFLYCNGNHDDNNFYARANGNLATMYFDSMERYNLTTRFSEYAITSIGSRKGHYYYVDNEHSKIRTIIMNSNDVPFMVNEDGTSKFNYNANTLYSNKQLNWLAKDALNFTDKTNKNEWGVIIIGHIVGKSHITNHDVLIEILKAFVSGASINKQGTNRYEDYNVSYDFSTQGAMEFITFILGDVHKDEVFDVEGFKAISTLNASLAKDHDVSPEKTYNTETETAWDIFTIDRDSKTIYATRFGAGSDRVIEY